MHSVYGVDYQLCFQPPVLDLDRFPLRKRGSARLSPGLSFFLLPWLLKVAPVCASQVCPQSSELDSGAHLTSLRCPWALHFRLPSRIHHEFALYLCIVSWSVIFLVLALVDIE